MSMPRVPLPLPVTEPRCSSDACPRTSDCARRRATVEHGSPMQDYSAVAAWAAHFCAGFIDLGSLHQAEKVPAVRPIKPYPAGQP